MIFSKVVSLSSSGLLLRISDWLFKTQVLVTAKHIPRNINLFNLMLYLLLREKIFSGIPDISTNLFIERHNELIISSFLFIFCLTNDFLLQVKILFLQSQYYFFQTDTFIQLYRILHGRMIKWEPFSFVFQSASDKPEILLYYIKTIKKQGRTMRPNGPPVKFSDEPINFTGAY